MKAEEAKKLMVRATAIAGLADVFKSIKEAAEQGKGMVRVSQHRLLEAEVEALRGLGYKVSQPSEHDGGGLRYYDFEVSWK
jgi:hypothetical protein